MTQYIQKSLLVALLQVFLWNLAFAQGFEASVPMNQYAPTPKALEMTRYGHMPPDLNSGIYSYDIPIYTYEDKDFTIPVSLHYSSSGFQPARMSDEAGLHWTLMAGGAITREIVGVDDFSYYGLNNSALQIIDSTLYTLANSTSANPVFHYAQGASTNVPSIDNDKECTSDRYHFTFPGHSGSFIMNHTGNAFRVYGTQDGRGLYDIQWNGSTKSFTIQTGDGYTYSFGIDRQSLLNKAKEINWTREAVINEQPSELLETNTHVVTWLLDKITAPDGRSVTFFYQSARTNQDIPTASLDDVVTSFYRNTYRRPSGSSNYYYKKASLTYTSYLNKIEIDTPLNTGKKLSISFDWQMSNSSEIAGTENVVYRSLVVPRRHLNKVEVKEGDDVLRSANIFYHQSGTRPLLDSIAISNSGGYKMTYWEDVTKPLPGILSNALDYWGYYNGQDNLNDNDDYYTATIDDYYNETPSSSRMNPSWTHARLGLLRSITYPTGGSTEISYESNVASKILLRRYYYQGGIVPSDPQQNIPNVSRAFLPSLHPYTSTEWSFAPSCGGVRVKTLTDKMGLASSIYTYNYGQGIVQEYPRFYVGKMNGVPKFSSVFHYPGSSFDQRHIAYKSITEVYPDSSSVVTTFSSWEDYPDEFSVYRESKADYVPLADTLEQLFLDNILREPDSRGYQRGLPLTRKTYDNSQKLLREESWEYEDQGSDYNAYALYSEQYAWTARTFLCDRKPIEYTFKEWSDDAGQSITENTTYSYNGAGQLSQTGRTVGSHTEISSISYPSDILGGIYPSMASAHFLDRPVERTLSRDGKLVQADLITYKENSGLYVPSESYQVKPEDGFAAYTFTPYDGQSIWSRYRKENAYVSYDSLGNLLESQDRDGVPTTYQWDSRGDKIAAIFIGATNGERTRYTRGAASHTETDSYVNADPAEKTFTCSVSGPFNFAFTPSDTTYGLTAKLDGTYYALQHVGNGAQGFSSPVTISAGSHTLEVYCTSMDPLFRGDEKDEIRAGVQPIETYPLTGILSITWPRSGAVAGSANGTDCFFEDFEVSGGSAGYGFHSNKGRTSSYTRGVSVATGRTYILDYMQRVSGVWQYVRSVKTSSTGTLYLSVAASASKPIDHVRFYPVDSVVSSYTWWPTGELRCKVDGTGYFESYEYDGQGRLVTVKDADGNRIKHYTYHYKH